MKVFKIYKHCILGYKCNVKHVYNIYYIIYTVRRLEAREEKLHSL